MLKQWGVVTIQQLWRSADRCVGITWCDVDVDRSRDILTNEAELWLIYLAPGHTPCYLLCLATFFLSFLLNFCLSFFFICFLALCLQSLNFFCVLLLQLSLSVFPLFFLSFSAEQNRLPSCSPTPFSLFLPSYLISLALSLNVLMLLVTKSQGSPFPSC